MRLANQICCGWYYWRMSGDDNNDDGEPGRLAATGKTKFSGIGKLTVGPATLTSVAYTSAEVFDPTNIEAIEAFQTALKKADKGVLFLLADEPENTAQANIETALPAKKVKLLTDVEIAQREVNENHKRELEVVREQTKGSAWVEVLKYGLTAVSAAILTYLGVR